MAGDMINNADGTWSQFTQLTGSLQKYVTLANAVTIADATQKTYNLISNGGLTEDVIRQFRKFKISINNSHDQTATVFIYSAIRGFNLTVFSAGGLLYTEANVLAAASGKLILQDRAVGTGAASNVKVVPALEGVYSNLFVGVQFAATPTSGSLTISVEMN